MCQFSLGHVSLSVMCAHSRATMRRSNEAMPLDYPKGVFGVWASLSLLKLFDSEGGLRCVPSLF